MDNPLRVRSAIFGGLGSRLVEGMGAPEDVAEALEASSLAAVSDPRARMFRIFAEQTESDLRALAACMRGSSQTLTPAQLATIQVPALVAIGSKDVIAGSAAALATLLPAGEALEIPGRDHMTAVGDKVFKQGVLSFLAARP
jgi:pimeloyl-ACP methyl ester carboxylesterase